MQSRISNILSSDPIQETLRMVVSETERCVPPSFTCFLKCDKFWKPVAVPEARGASRVCHLNGSSKAGQTP